MYSCCQKQRAFERWLSYGDAKVLSVRAGETLRWFLSDVWLCLCTWCHRVSGWTHLFTFKEPFPENPIFFIISPSNAYLFPPSFYLCIFFIFEREKGRKRERKERGLLPTASLTMFLQQPEPSQLGDRNPEGHQGIKYLSHTCCFPGVH